MSPFTPVGAVARWRVIYDLMRVAKVGEIVTYVAMATALELHPDQDRTTIQLAVRRAVKELETEDRRTAKCVPNRGYQVVEPGVQLDLARHHQGKAGRALQRAHSKAVNVDFNGMDAGVRQAFELVGQALAAQIDLSRRLSVRTERLEKALSSTTERGQRTEAEVAALHARLAALEVKFSGGQ